MVSQYEVPLVPQPDLYPASRSLRGPDAQMTGQWMRHCVQIPGHAKGRVSEPFPAHTTMVCSMIPADEGFHQSTMEGHG